MRKTVMLCAAGLLSLAWGTGWSYAQNDAPEPAPTNAAQSLERKLQVEGYGQLPFRDSETGRRDAYQAAVLDAYQQLLWQGAEHLGLLSEPNLDTRTFRIDAQHPNPVLLDWVLRSTVLDQQATAGRLRVSLESPPLGELTSDFPHLVRSLQQDVDGDGATETVGVTYDGRIQVLKPVAHGFRLLASSPSLNVLACHVVRQPGKDSWEQVQLSRALSLSSLEPLGGGKLRAVAEVTLGESIDERWLGKATEQREVLLRWDDPKAEPEIDVTEPRDFLATTKDKVAWKGQLRMPAGLEQARLRVNGRPFWQSPERLASQRLRMDILLPLLPGVNRAQVALTDQNRRATSREVLLFRDAPCPPVQPKQRRALLIGLPEYQAEQFPQLGRVGSDLDRLKSFLARPDGGAVAPENIEVLQGKAATRAAILDSLRRLSKVEGDERTLLLVYFAGLSAPSAGAGGKVLLPYDARGFDEGALTPADLAAAVGELQKQDVVLIADTSQNSLLVGPSDQLWMDAQEFSEGLSRHGWAVLSSVDGGVDSRDSELGSRLLTAYLEGCGAAGDGNGDGFVEWDEAYRHLFQTLRVSSPGTVPPLRRGEVLGRVPLSVCRPTRASVSP